MRGLLLPASYPSFLWGSSVSDHRRFRRTVRSVCSKFSCHPRNSSESSENHFTAFLVSLVRKNVCFHGYQVHQRTSLLVKGGKALIVIDGDVDK